MQTRSQAKSSGVTVPYIHGIEKSLVPHVKPKRQKSVVKPPIDKRPPTNNRLPIPKPRLGQGRAGIRRKARVVPPTQTPIQTPAHNVATSLPEAVMQSQERVQPQHQFPTQTPIRQSTSPTSIKQPIGPRIEYEPIPFYPDQILRLPPWPPCFK